MVLDLSKQPIVLETEGKFEYTIHLNQPPITSDVNIAFSSSNTALITTPTSLTFTSQNFDVPQTVSLTIVNTGGIISGRY